MKNQILAQSGFTVLPLRQKIIILRRKHKYIPVFGGYAAVGLTAADDLQAVVAAAANNSQLNLWNLNLSQVKPGQH